MRMIPLSHFQYHFCVYCKLPILLKGLSNMCPDHQPATVATILPKLSDLPNKPPNLHLAESIQNS